MATKGKGISMRVTAIGSRVFKQIGKIADPARIVDDIVAYADDFTGDVVDQLKDYPPPRPNSKYIRTQTLQRGWRYRQSAAGGNISFVIYNDATDPRGRKYAGFVQGAQQVAIHEETGWLTIQEAMNRARFAEGIQRVITSYL